VNSDEPESLADRAAAWVPPWERGEVPDADEPAAAPQVEAEPEAVAEPALESEPVDESEPFVEPLVAAEPEPVVELEPEREPEPTVPVMAPAQIRGALEAIMLVVDEPVSEVVLAQVLEQPKEVVTEALHTLADEYTLTGRGFELRRAAGGWRLYTRGDYASYVERFVLDGQQVRVTQAALETLAVVAYKQPVTRSRISAIRGVNCDAVVRTLVSRGLIEECGTEPDSGAYLYRTTTLFLEKLGLDSVDELPALAPFLPDDVDEIADAQS